LGTVLANDEVKDGLSVRGGHPVIQKDMEQWLLRVTAYAERLLESLDSLEWTDSMKEIQRNWIGRSEGAQILFNVKDSDIKIEVFTTRPDTIFGSTFMVIAPESNLTQQLTTMDNTEIVDEYIEKTKKRTERDRISDAKTVSGVFSGSYAINPFTLKEIPIWISDYVLAGYGTGAIMAVPAHDSRDYAFAKHFDLPIIQVVDGGEIITESYDAKDGKLINSNFLNGLEVKEAVTKIVDEIEKMKIGERKINYRLRDAIFSRQRYWGEPFPVYYADEIPQTISINELPLQLPSINEYKPTETGEPPLGRAENWNTAEGLPFELSTMPGFAGSSAYYLRYMDPHNKEELVSAEANSYWQDVDLYIGGTEHAVGHLIYSRFWNKFLFDLEYTVKDEPFKKLINQGMIQGRSSFVYRIKGTNIFVSKNLNSEYDISEIHVDVNIVHNDILDIEKFKNWRPEFNNAEFILESDGKYRCGFAVEKMSKSLYNVVNPDDIIEQYGADTFRMYEMFLGPVEQAKPWDTNGIEGVHKFLKKLWNLFYDKDDKFIVNNDIPSSEEQKIIHKTIKKVEEDIKRFSFNTSVSAFMICVNELSVLNCHKKEILDKLMIILSPFAPHIAEEMWSLSGNNETINKAKFPIAEEKYLIEENVNYPVAFNGKTKFTFVVSAETKPAEIEKMIIEDSRTISKLEGKIPKKIIIIPGRMINIVL
jgi:leucyl-tRNA synthetase